MTKEEFLKFIDAACLGPRLPDALTKWEYAFARIGPKNPALPIVRDSDFIKTYGRALTDFKTWRALYQRILALRAGGTWEADDDTLSIIAVNSYIIYHFIINGRLNDVRKRLPLLAPAIADVIDPALNTFIIKDVLPLSAPDDGKDATLLSEANAQQLNHQTEVTKNWRRLLQATRIAILCRDIDDNSIAAVVLPYNEKRRNAVMRLLWQYSIGVAADANLPPPADDIAVICTGSFHADKTATQLIKHYCITDAEMTLSLEQLADERREHIRKILSVRAKNVLIKQFCAQGALITEPPNEKNLRQQNIVKTLNGIFERAFPTEANARIVSLRPAGEIAVDENLLQNLAVPIVEGRLFRGEFINAMDDLCEFFKRTDTYRTFTDHPDGTWAVLAAIAEFDFAIFLQTVAKLFQTAPAIAIERRLKSFAPYKLNAGGYQALAAGSSTEPP